MNDLKESTISDCLYGRRIRCCSFLSGTWEDEIDEGVKVDGFGKG